MAPEENIMAELDVVKQMAGLMKTLDDEGKRRALWYLADLAGLSSRSSPQPMPIQQPMPMPPGVQSGGSTPRGIPRSPEVRAAP